MERTVDQHFQELSELVKGLAILGELSPRSIDAISSFGERLSSLIVTNHFQKHGLNAVHVDARKVIVTDHRHTHANPLYPETYARLAETIPPLAKNLVVVMGGFIAATPDGIGTTLGRGGSDFTAAIVGAGIGAEEIQIWTDVDGMLTCDPTIHPKAGIASRNISFAEAAELAYFGAKVLHPATVIPAIEKNIPGDDPELAASASGGHAYRRRVDSVDECGEVDRVQEDGDGAEYPIAADVHGARVFAANLRSVRSVRDVGGHDFDVGGYVSVTIDHTERAARRFGGVQREFADVDVLENQSIICLVGEKIPVTAGVGADFQGSGNINARMVSEGASSMNMGFVVDGHDLDTGG
jgi:aspartate kinase